MAARIFILFFGAISRLFSTSLARLS